MILREIERIRENEKHAADLVVKARSDAEKIIRDADIRAAEHHEERMRDAEAALKDKREQAEMQVRREIGALEEDSSREAGELRSIGKENLAQAATALVKIVTGEEDVLSGQDA